MKTCLTLLVSVAALLSLSGCGSDEPDIVVNIGSPTPEFALKDLNGDLIKSSSYLGKPMVLNFWATYCRPCRGEIPVLKKLDAEEEVQVLTIALDTGGISPIQKFVKRHDISYKVLVGNEKIFKKFNGFGIPYTLVLDSTMKVVSIHRGVATEEELRKDLLAIR